MSHDSAHQAHFEGSRWPIFGSIGLFLIAVGFVNWIHDNTVGPYIFLLGALVFSYMLYGWFAAVIKENQAGLYLNEQARSAFRWGMFWFIFTEAAFFITFFGVLFYTRVLSVPWLGGAGTGELTHLILWPGFKGVWPVIHTPNPAKFLGPTSGLDPWGVPVLNTLALLLSDVAITWGYWGQLKGRRHQLNIGLAITLILSVTFIWLQVIEYGNAYFNKHLMMSSGIYGATFYMLTGVHATHVIAGIIMLLVLLGRSFKGHFDTKNNFAIGAISWYWHFIDVLWIALFIFVYWV